MTPGSLRVLVIDDQPIILEAVRGMLAEAGDLEMHLHSDSGTAVEAALRFGPDVILLDLNMEPVDGLEVLARIRAHPILTDVSVVMLSAEENAATKVECFRRGANDYVVKLPTALELNARVRYHAGACQAAREREASFQALLESRAALEQRNRLIEEQGEQLKAMNRDLTEASLTDALTGLRNRRYLEIFLEQSAGDPSAAADAGTADAVSPQAEFVFCLMDLDHFKQINDRHGHEAGDTVLVEVGRRIRACLQAGDVAMRWGGEEFLIVGRDRGEARAAELAQHLLRAIGDTPVALPSGQSLTVTSSLGFTTMPWTADRAGRTLSRDQILNLADIALYLAKHEGRNRACGVFPGPGRSIVERVVRLELAWHGLRAEDGHGVRLLTIPGPVAATG